MIIKDEHQAAIHTYRQSHTLQETLFFMVGLIGLPKKKGIPDAWTGIKILDDIKAKVCS